MAEAGVCQRAQLTKCRFCARAQCQRCFEVFGKVDGCCLKRSGAGVGVGMLMGAGDSLN